PVAPPGPTHVASSLARPAPHLRQLDERPLPRGRARGVYPACVRDYGPGALARLPGLDQAVTTARRACAVPAVAIERLAGRLGGERPLHHARGRSREGARRCQVPLSRAAAGADPRADAGGAATTPPSCSNRRSASL